MSIIYQINVIVNYIKIFDFIKRQGRFKHTHHNSENMIAEILINYSNHHPLIYLFLNY